MLLPRFMVFISVMISMLWGDFFFMYVVISSHLLSQAVCIDLFLPCHLVCDTVLF